MPPTSHHRIDRLLLMFTGLLLIGSTFVLNLAFSRIDPPRAINVLLVGCGCTFLVLAFALRQSRAKHALAKASLAFLSAWFTLVIAEVFFRVTGYDFQRRDEMPIYFRPPLLDMGGGILRREGPASWHGRPLSEMVRIKFGERDAYPGERPITVEYDANGFRNPPDLADWEVVVAGDSFVELGFLPYDKLFTTVAAKQLGIRIKNLGVSATGPIFQTEYARRFGKAPSTRDAVLCFFEGNDVMDLRLESKHTNAAFGPRYAEAPVQSSLLTAIWQEFRSPLTNKTDDSGMAFLRIGTNEWPAIIGSVPPCGTNSVTRSRDWCALP